MKSIDSFKENLSQTENFVKRIYITTYVYKDIGLAKHTANELEDLQTILDYGEEHFSKIYETGFILLFANFEFFMYDFVKELFTTFPKSMSRDKSFRADEILQIENAESIKDYIIDSIAVDKSYDLEVWCRTLEACFQIKPFTDPGHKRNFAILNTLRNSYMHAGGHITSKVFKDGMKALNNGKSLTYEIAKFSIPSEGTYRNTVACFKKVIENLSDWDEQRNKKVVDGSKGSNGDSLQ